MHASTHNTPLLQVPKVLASRFHATTRTTPEPPPAKRRRVFGAGSGGGGGGSGSGSGGATPEPADAAWGAAAGLQSGGFGFGGADGDGGAAAGTADDAPGAAAAATAAAATTAGRGVHGVFRTFATQAAAFDFWDAQGPARAARLRAFAAERDATGRRAFLITTPERFWAEYRAIPHAARSHYEIIRQGCPCHLYLDLEFVPELNPSTDGGGLVRLIVEEIGEALRVCGGGGDRRGQWTGEGQSAVLLLLLLLLLWRRLHPALHCCSSALNLNPTS